MAFIRTLCCIFAFLIILLVSPNSSSFPSIIQIYPEKESFLLNDGGSAGRGGVDLYCESWKFTVETNDAGSWGPIPERCLDFVKEYVTGARYTSDSEAVADSAVAYAKSVRFSGDGKDAWVFDIDKMLLSNVPYYAAHGFGSDHLSGFSKFQYGWRFPCTSMRCSVPPTDMPEFLKLSCEMKYGKGNIATSPEEFSPRKPPPNSLLSSTAEGRGQNFLDEDNEIPLNFESPTKRLKMAGEDSSIQRLQH